MRKIVLPTAFLIIVLACNFGSDKRNQTFINENNSGLIIVLTDDGRCLIPDRYDFKPIQCSYKIAGDKIQFFYKGTGAQAAIDRRCIIFSNVKYCSA